MLFLSTFRLWHPLVVRLHLTTLRSWTLPCYHHWPLQPGPARLMSSPQPPQPCHRICLKLRPRLCSFSVGSCPAWSPYHFQLSRQTAWPLLPLLCTCSPHHVRPTTGMLITSNYNVSVSLNQKGKENYIMRSNSEHNDNLKPQSLKLTKLLFCLSASCPSNLEELMDRWVVRQSQSPGSATHHLYWRMPYHRRTLG